MKRVQLSECYKITSISIDLLILLISVSPNLFSNSTFHCLAVSPIPEQDEVISDVTDDNGGSSEEKTIPVVKKKWIEKKSSIWIIVIGAIIISVSGGIILAKLVLAVL